jgi:hypothetical protein
VAIEVWNHRKHRTLSEHASVTSLSDNDSHYVYRLPKSIDGCTELKDVVLYHRNVRARPNPGHHRFTKWASACQSLRPAMMPVQEISVAAITAPCVAG